MKTYDYVIIGAGIAGCSVAYELENEDVLLIDRNSDVALGASGAAGAFLSPLLGKDNKFKTLVTKALKYSTSFYLKNTKEAITNCGVVRIPKNKEDEIKFKTYKSHMDFEYIEKEKGVFFKIGSIVIPADICNILTKKINKLFNYDVKHINYSDKFWFINHEIKTKNLIITTGADTSLIKEKYFNIRAIWGQKIDITSTTCIDVNYHKECSLSLSTYDENLKLNKISIGATHHRFNCNSDICNYCLKTTNINKMHDMGYTKEVSNIDTQELLKKANNIKSLAEVNVTSIKVGARASSVDYFPMVGKLIDSKKTIDMFPYLNKGTKVPDENFSLYDNLYIINGVGGRGFVLSPYLAKELVLNIKTNKVLDEDIKVNRLFKRWVRKN